MESLCQLDFTGGSDHSFYFITVLPLFRIHAASYTKYMFIASYASRMFLKLINYNILYYTCVGTLSKWCR